MQGMPAQFGWDTCTQCRELIWMKAYRCGSCVDRTSLVCESCAAKSPYPGYILCGSCQNFTSAANGPDPGLLEYFGAYTDVCRWCHGQGTRKNPVHKTGCISSKMISRVDTSQCAWADLGPRFAEEIGFESHLRIPACTHPFTQDQPCTMHYMISEASRAYHRQRIALGQAEKKVTDLQQKHKSQIADLRRKYASADKDFGKVLAQLDGFKRKIKELDDKNKKLELENKHFADKQKEFEQQTSVPISSAPPPLTDFPHNEAYVRATAAEQKVATHEQTILALRQQIAQNNLEHKTLAGENGKMIKEISHLRGEISKYEGKFSEYTRSTSELQKRFNAAKQTIAELELKTGLEADNMQQSQGYEKALREMKTRITRLETDLDDMTKERDDKARRLADLEYTYADVLVTRPTPMPTGPDPSITQIAVYNENALMSGITRMISVDLGPDWTHVVEFQQGVSMKLWLDLIEQAKRRRRGTASVTKMYKLAGELRLQNPSGMPNLAVIAPSMLCESCEIVMEGTVEVEEIEDTDTQIPINFPNTYTAIGVSGSAKLALTIVATSPISGPSPPVSLVT